MLLPTSTHRDLEKQRQNEKQMRGANRELASDLRQLEKKEHELVCIDISTIGPDSTVITPTIQMAQIKSLAKAGQKDACTVLAKQLVQLRNQKTKNINVGAQITSMASRGRSV